MKWLLLCRAAGGLRNGAVPERSGRIGGMRKAGCGGGKETNKNYIKGIKNIRKYKKQKILNCNLHGTANLTLTNRKHQMSGTHKTNEYPGPNTLLSYKPKIIEQLLRRTKYLIHQILK